MSIEDLAAIQTIVEWIETHQATVDLLKWVALGVLAWLTGGFRYIRNLLRQPTATFEDSTSRCMIEEMPEVDGYKNGIRATFLVEVGLLNPTEKSVNIRRFFLAIPRQRFWKRWKPELVALSLPSRPRLKTGSGIKLIRNWFSKFPDGYDELTITGTVGPQGFETGYLLFVYTGYGAMAPKIDGQFINVKARVNLTTGETCSVSGKVRVVSDPSLFEEWLPGITEQINHDSAWGATR